jgi:hypothetical protein
VRVPTVGGDWYAALPAGRPNAVLVHQLGIREQGQPVPQPIQLTSPRLDHLSVLHATGVVNIDYVTDYVTTLYVRQRHSGVLA